MGTDGGIIRISFSPSRDNNVDDDLGRALRENPSAEVLEVRLPEKAIDTRGLEQASRFAEEQGLTLRLRRTQD